MRVKDLSRAKSGVRRRGTYALYSRHVKSIQRRYETVYDPCPAMRDSLSYRAWLFLDLLLVTTIFIYILWVGICKILWQDAESEASVQQALDTLVERGAGSTTVVLVAHR